MTRTRTFAAALVAVVLLLAACSDDDGDTDSTGSGDTTEAAADESTTTAAGTSGSETTEAAAEGASLATAETDLGTILVDGQGNTLYLFTSDTQGEPSTCTGGCAAAWPALAGSVTAGDGVDAALIGTVAGADGTEQATYDGWPLYYYAQDTGPGDTTGQGVGGVWWVVAPDGTAIES
jgi:predicted lipoprotein with Yx(FWY)xxD motif